MGVIPNISVKILNITWSFGTKDTSPVEVIENGAINHNLDVAKEILAAE